MLLFRLHSPKGKESSLPSIHFQVRTASFREDIIYILIISIHSSFQEFHPRLSDPHPIHFIRLFIIIPFYLLLFIIIVYSACVIIIYSLLLL